jgi:hypothetical protein
MEDNGGRRAALEAAFDKMEAAEAEAAPAPVEAEPAPVVEAEAAPAPAAGERVRDDKGRFAPMTAADTHEAPKPKAEEAEKPAPVAAKPTLEAAPKAPVEAAPVTSKAPASWRPVEREAWATLPKAAQDAVIRREREIEAGMREASEARQNWSRFEEVARPFLPFMAMNGSDPIQAASNMFRTTAMLQSGSPIQKAGMMAQVMMQYAVDPELVYAALQGAPPPAQQPRGEIRDPRVDQLLSRLESAKAEKEKAVEARLQQEIETFAQKAEWFSDVRIPMADLIEVWDRQGKITDSNLTEMIQKAYDVAVQMNPDIAQAVRQRQAAGQASTAQANLQRAKNAASSVRSQPTVGGSGPPKNRREALERAYDEQVNRRA